MQALLLLCEPEPCSERHIQTIISCGIDPVNQSDVLLSQSFGLGSSVLKLLFLLLFLCMTLALGAQSVTPVRSAHLSAPALRHSHHIRRQHHQTAVDEMHRKSCSGRGRRQRGQGFG